MEKTKFLGTIKYIAAENHCKFEIRYANGEDGFCNRIYQVQTTLRPPEYFVAYAAMYDTPRLRKNGLDKGLSIEDMLIKNMYLIVSTTEYTLTLPFIGMQKLVKRTAQKEYFHTDQKQPVCNHGTLMPSEVFNEIIYHATSDVWMSVEFEAIKVCESQRPIGDSFGMTVSGVKRNDIYQLVYAESAEDVLSFEFITGSNGKAGYKMLLINGVLVTKGNGHIDESLVTVLHEEYKSGATIYTIHVEADDEILELFQYSAYGVTDSVESRFPDTAKPKGNNPFEGLNNLINKKQCK